MAKAFVSIKQFFNRQNTSEVDVSCTVSFFGSDVDDNGAVQGPHDITALQLSVGQNSPTVAQIHAACASAARDKATELSLTVGSGEVYLSSGMTGGL